MRKSLINFKSEPRNNGNRPLMMFVAAALLLLFATTTVTTLASAGITVPSGSLNVPSENAQIGFNCFSTAAGWDHADDEALGVDYTNASSNPNGYDAAYYQSADYQALLEKRSIDNCIVDNNYGLTQAMWAGSVISLIPGFLVFVLVPLVCAGRYCCNCCGSWKRRPNAFFFGAAEDDKLDERAKQKLYLPEIQRRWQGFVAVLLLLATIASAMILVGKNLTKNAYDDWKDSVNANVAALYADSLTQVDTYLQFPNNGSYVSPFTEDSYLNALGVLPSTMSAFYKSEASNYISDENYALLLIATNVWSVVPVTSLLLLFFICSFDIRSVVPILAILLFWVVGVVGSVFGFFGFRLLGPMTMMCDEVDTYLAADTETVEYQDSVALNALIPSCRGVLQDTTAFSQQLSDAEAYYSSMSGSDSIAAEVSENMAAAQGYIVADPCVTIVDGLSQSFGQCSDATVGLQLVVAGLIINSIVSALAIIVTFRGQKLFFKRLKGRKARKYYAKYAAQRRADRDFERSALNASTTTMNESVITYTMDDSTNPPASGDASFQGNTANYPFPPTCAFDSSMQQHNANNTNGVVAVANEESDSSDEEMEPHSPDVLIPQPKGDEGAPYTYPSV